MPIELGIPSAVQTLLDIGLAGLLFVAGAGKLLDLEAWRGALWGYGIGWMRWRPLVLVLPLTELAIGLGVALGRRIGEFSAVALFLAFAVVLAVAYRGGARGACDCFGSVLPSAIGPAAIARALTLAAIATIAGLSVERWLDPTAQLLASVVCAAVALTAGELNTLRAHGA